jgi:hypothetical protein
LPIIDPDSLLPFEAGRSLLTIYSALKGFAGPDLLKCTISQQPDSYGFGGDGQLPSRLI